MIKILCIYIYYDFNQNLEDLPIMDFLVKNLDIIRMIDDIQNIKKIDKNIDVYVSTYNIYGPLGTVIEDRFF